MCPRRYKKKTPRGLIPGASILKNNRKPRRRGITAAIVGGRDVEALFSPQLIIRHFLKEFHKKNEKRDLKLGERYFRAKVPGFPK